jgi:hypothetical protein
MTDKKNLWADLWDVAKLILAEIRYMRYIKYKYIDMKRRCFRGYKISGVI